MLEPSHTGFFELMYCDLVHLVNSFRIKRDLGMASRKKKNQATVTQHHNEPHFCEVRTTFLISLWLHGIN